MKKIKYYTRFMTDYCEIIVVGNNEGITNLHMETGAGKRSFEVSGDWIRDDHLFEDAVIQIKEYFSGRRKYFDLDVAPKGTDFQLKVWAELCRIPFGSICSYKDVAVRIGNPKACRAVGMANSKNPVPLLIPCHRVIGSSGSLTGFAHGMEFKKRLIDLEKEGLRQKG